VFYVSTDAQGRITQYGVDLREFAAPQTDGPMTFFDFYNSDWLFGTNDRCTALSGHFFISRH